MYRSFTVDHSEVSGYQDESGGCVAELVQSQIGLLGAVWRATIKSET
jgi:hypothetical protein